MYTILSSGELRRLLLRGRDPHVGRGGRQPRPLGHGRKEIRSKIFKNLFLKYVFTNGFTITKEY
jgi:hypothetical protein